MAPSVDVKGLPELSAALARKAAEAQAAATKAVADEVALVRADAHSEAPKDSGELAAAITGAASGTSGVVESTARHTGFVEFGTFKDRAQPFMAPAAERSRSRFPAGAAATIGAALRGK